MGEGDFLFYCLGLTQSTSPGCDENRDEKIHCLEFW